MRRVVNGLAQLVDGKVAAMQTEIALTTPEAHYVNQSNQSMKAMDSDQTLNQSASDRRTKIIALERSFRWIKIRIIFKRHRIWLMIFKSACCISGCISICN
jgi:hypothetical protein